MSVVKSPQGTFKTHTEYKYNRQNISIMCKYM